MRVAAVIPARFASTRLPGKPLSLILNKPMIQWVYEQTLKARGLNQVVVATDDQRVVEAVESFGGNAIMTSADIASGTDRIAAVAKKLPADVYVNVQGDEPLMSPLAIEKTIELVTSGRFQMASVMTPLKNVDDLRNPSVVKVIVDKNQRAIYFSRLPIPYSRKNEPDQDEGYICRQHVGLYVYTRDTLLRLTALPASPLEKYEVLEQLRALENGISIGMAEADFTSVGVDTQEDLEKVIKILEGGAKYG